MSKRSNRETAIVSLTEMSFARLQDLLSADDGDAAAEHLNAGRPVYIRDSLTPTGSVTRLWPDGRREHVKFSVQRGEVVVGDASQDHD